MGKLEDKKKQKKEALLTSAFQLFTEKGIDNTSVAEIVNCAKMAKGTFYLYFKDKYEIQDCLIAQQANGIFEIANQKLNQWLSKERFFSFEECVIFLVDCIIDQLARNPSLLRFISKNLSWGVFSNIRFTKMDNQNYMDVFDAILEKSEKQYRQKELMIYMIVELVNATCYNVILDHMPVSLEELKKELYPAIQGILHQFEAA